MKIKNIAVGDSVQIKKRLVSNIFSAKQVCEVIKIDAGNKFGLDVLVKGKHCLNWVNHKDLKKPIEREPEPQLKQLDQSIFDGLDEKWRFAMVSSVGIPIVYDYKPTGMRAFLSDSSAQLMVNLGKVMRIDEYDYDASNWQNSLIERDIAKELLEVDLSSELTGSDLCRKMIERGDKFVMCLASDESQEDTLLDGYSAAIDSITDNGCFYGYDFTWLYVTPINNQGEPLTASEVGL